MRLIDILEGGKHFKRPNMSDWLIVKGDYIVFEGDPRARPILTVSDWKAEDWVCDISNEEALAAQFDKTYKDILRDPDSHLSDTAVEKFLALEDTIRKILNEALTKGNQHKDKFEGIKMEDLLAEMQKHKPGGQE